MKRPGPAPRANSLAPYMALAALWMVTLTVVPPRGNFPLNDDWMYAKVVQHLAETGRYEASPYADPTFILQAYWGAAFVKVLGFSFETLRASTLVLALVVLWAAHWAAREAGLNVRWAFLVAVTFLVNPLFLNLSYTFMTDVPFLAVTTLSIAAFLRALRTKRISWLWAAGFIGAAGCFVRQFAILVPLAFAPAIALRSINGFSRKSSVRRDAIHAAIAITVPWIAAFIVMKAMPVGGEGLSGKWKWSVLGDTLPDRTVEILRFTFSALLYVALFLAPIVIDYWMPRWEKNRSWRTRVDWQILPSAFVILLLTLPFNQNGPPHLGNVLYDTGVGPLLMPGMVEGARIASPLSFRGLWVVLGVFGLLCGAFVAWQIVKAFRQALRSKEDSRDTDGGIDLFLSLLAIAMIVVLILPPVQARFDRYLLAAQVPLSVICARAIERQFGAKSRWMVSAISAAAFWIFGLIALQDYLAWNAARWKALHELQTVRQIPIGEINGGYEFNGWYHSDHFAEESRRTGKKVFGPLGWWTLKDDYRVSLRHDKHFEVIGTEPYFSWLGFQRREVLLLHRTKADPFL